MHISKYPVLWWGTCTRKHLAECSDSAAEAVQGIWFPRLNIMKSFDKQAWVSPLHLLISLQVQNQSVSGLLPPDKSSYRSQVKRCLWKLAIPDLQICRLSAPQWNSQAWCQDAGFSWSESEINISMNLFVNILYIALQLYLFNCR